MGAASGVEGLVKTAEQPNAILLDVMMPDMDRLSLLRQPKENAIAQAISMILLTAKLPGFKPE
jgi:CheY-like chemotaxis protein